MAEERIQKIMSEQGLCSRRAAEQIIAEGRVKVNGHPVKVGSILSPTLTGWPLTLTRPSAMICSAARREHKPCSAMIF